MPLYPFILLGAIFLVVVTVPPLVAAFIDEKRQQFLSGTQGKDGTSQDGAGSNARRDGHSG